MKHRSKSELQDKLDHIKASPKSDGTLQLIVCRPEANERIMLKVGNLDKKYGLLGDNWYWRSSSRTPDGSAHPETQINIMNARSIEALAGEKENWPLAGDQLYVDFDLSEDNLPAGSKLKIGGAILQVSEIPHNGCLKFMDRFGQDGLQFVNSKEGKSLHLRGINAWIIEGGVIKTGDSVNKV